MGKKPHKWTSNEHDEINIVLDEAMYAYTFLKHILPLLTEHELTNLLLQDRLFEIWHQLEEIKNKIELHKPELYNKYIDIDDMEDQYTLT